MTPASASCAIPTAVAPLGEIGQQQLEHVGLVPTSLLFVIRPSINPDQIWAMRRFVPTALPLVVLPAAIAISFIEARLVDRSPFGRPGLWGLVALMVGTPALISAPLISAHDEVAAVDTIKDFCRELGERPALLVDDADPLGTFVSVPARTICAIPTAVAPLGEIDTGALARAWEAEGRRLVLVSTSVPAGDSWQRMGDGEFRMRGLDATLTRRPESVSSQQLGYAVFAHAPPAG